MKTLAISLTLLLTLVACSSGQSGVTSVPGHGAVAIEVIPNPIMATLVSGNTYDFPFEVVVRETGGRPVTVQRVTARVFLGGGLTLATESWDAQRIRSMGYNTTLGANSEVRYRFSPRKDVPDDRIFGGVSAELKVEATDDTGAATEATTAVTVSR
jgi:hypothetical protein